MPKAKFLKPEKPIAFDAAMKRAMRVPPEKKTKLREVWRKKRR